jgi:hypothetical protein
MCNGLTVWGLGFPLVLQRRNFYDSSGETKTVIVFELRPEQGFYASNIAAKRAYLEAMEPDLIGCDDNFIRLHWRYCQNLGTAKIIKVKTLLPYYLKTQ